jgi:CTP synthase
MEEQKSITNLGGTMRLGAYACHLKSGTKVAEAYGKLDIEERHRHCFEFNEEFRKQFEDSGMVFAGENPETHLVEVMELPNKKWYIGTQYHPEYSSTVLSPHPLFIDFVRAAINNKNQRAAK